MEWLNYHHLLYFWTVAREGSIAKAAKSLSLASPTVHAQIRALEDSLGQKLLVRRGRGLVLTDAGRVVLGYADEIFSLGRELMTAVKQQPTDRGFDRSLLAPFVERLRQATVQGEQGFDER